MQAAPPQDGVTVFLLLLLITLRVRLHTVLLIMKAFHQLQVSVRVYTGGGGGRYVHACV